MLVVSSWIVGISLEAQQQLPRDLRGFGLNPSAPASTGGLSFSSLHGIVVSTDNVPVSGAQVRFTTEDHSLLEASTGSDGSFTFPEIPPGTCTLEVSLSGFAPVSTSVTVPPNASMTMAPIAIEMVSVTVSIDVVAPRQEVAAAQLHFEEQQRLVGIVPNFYVSYDWNAAPLTTRQKFSLALKNTPILETFCW